MIAHLRGKLIEATVQANGIAEAVIDVAGVGYLVFVTDKTAGVLQNSSNSQDGEAALFIETHIREDHIHLFGFLSAADRMAFRILSTVQGVGAKVAMAILQVLDAEHLQTAILCQDSAAFTKAAGVGNKLATRIISELKDKDIGLLSPPPSSPSSSSADSPEKPHAKTDAPIGTNDPIAPIAPIAVIRNDSLSALVNLGYDKSQAYQAVAQILQEKIDNTEAGANVAEGSVAGDNVVELSTAECIRLALQKLAAA